MTETLARHTDIRVCLVVGGLSAQQQEAALRQSPDIGNAVLFGLFFVMMQLHYRFNCRFFVLTFTWLCCLLCHSRGDAGSLDRSLAQFALGTLGGRGDFGTGRGRSTARDGFHRRGARSGARMPQGPPDDALLGDAH